MHLAWEVVLQRIRHLAVAVSTVVALAAIWGAASASAAEFLAEGSSTVKSGGAGSNLFSFKDSAGSCNEFQLNTSISGTHTKSLGSKPPASKCSSLFWGQVKNNGCEVSYQPGAQTGSASFSGTVKIASGGCAFEFEGKCPVSIPAQTVSATFANTESGTKRSVEVAVNTSSLTYTETGGASCSIGTYNTGSWSGTTTLKAYSGETQKGLWVGTNPISISGSPAKLVAGSENLALSGLANEQLLIKGKYGSIGCSESSFGSNIFAPVSQFTAQTALGGCIQIGKASTVSMNGCSFVVNIESTTKGRADVSCPAGKSIEFANGKCAITIPAQATDSGDITFAQTFSMVQMTLAVTGVDFHQQFIAGGIGTCSTGDSTEGTISGSYTLDGGYF